MQKTAYGVFVTSWNGRASRGATYIIILAVAVSKIGCTDWIVFCVDAEKRDFYCQKRFSRRCVSIVRALRRVSPNGTLQLPVSRSAREPLTNATSYRSKSCRYLVFSTFSALRLGFLDSTSTCLPTTALVRPGSAQVAHSHLLKTFRKLSAIVFEYTSRPIQLLCRARDPAARSHGLEQATAAFSAHRGPSSPRY